MYAYSDMECLHRHNFLSFQAIYCFLPHYLPQKLKFGKNVIKHLDIPSFYTCVPLIKIIWCMVPKIWSSTDRIFFSSWAIFCPFTSLPPWKIKISKTKKNPGDIFILYRCTKSHDHLLYCSRDMAHDGCNCYFHFGLSGIFPSTFLLPVYNTSRNLVPQVVVIHRFDCRSVIYERSESSNLKIDFLGHFLLINESTSHNLNRVS